MRKVYVHGDEIGRIPIQHDSRAMSYLIKNKNMRTYGDILKVPAWELRSYFDFWYDYMDVRDAVHNKGYSLLGEHLLLGLSLDPSMSEELADIKLRDCHLSTGLYNVLANADNKKHSITTLGDLVIVDYDDLLNLRGMGVTKMNELHDFMRKKGFLFYNGEVPIEEMPAILRENGIMPIEDLSLTPFTVTILHNNDVHSVSDALRDFDNISSFAEFGDKRFKEFSEKLSSVVTFKEISNSVKQRSIDVIRSSWDKDYFKRQAMKDDVKNQSELDNLSAEKMELLRRLDYINTKINFLESYPSKTYVKKGE